MSDNEERTLREKLEDGDYSIEVKETIRRGPKVALNKHGERTLTKEENEQLRRYMDRYKDLIIAIDEKGSELDGFDKAWSLGKLMVDAEEEAEEEDEPFSFEGLVPAISAFKFSSSLAYRYRKLYQMFPDGGYDPSYSHTTIAEMAQRADTPEEAREAYKRMDDADIQVTENDVRVWGSSTDNLDSIVDAALDRLENNYVESVKNVCILHGIEPIPNEDDIKDVIEELS